MRRLMKLTQLFCADRAGITAIEYGLIAAVMVGLIGVAFGLLGEPLRLLFADIALKLVVPAP